MIAVAANAMARARGRKRRWTAHSRDANLDRDPKRGIKYVSPEFPLLAGRGIAAGVIVDDDDRGGGQCDGAGARLEASLNRPLARRKAGSKPEARN